MSRPFPSSFNGRLIVTIRYRIVDMLTCTCSNWVASAHFIPFSDTRRKRVRPRPYSVFAARSEHVFDRQLKDSGVESACDLAKVQRPERKRDPGTARRRTRKRNARAEAVGQVECFTANLYSLTLRDAETPRDGNVQLPECGTRDIAAIHRAQRSQSG